MKKITIVWTITLVIIVVGLTVIGFKIKRENISNIMEDAIVEKTQKYFGLYPSLYPTLGEEKRITVGELIDNGYDPELEDGCDGYIIIKNTNNGFKYYPYVSCPDYVTEGYSEK